MSGRSATLRCLPPARAVVAFGAILMLSACKTFSPDGGMDVVAGIAGQPLRKDVVFVRTGEDELAAREAIERLL